MFKLLARRKYANMSSFTQILNPITGKNEWNVECEGKYQNKYFFLFN